PEVVCSALELFPGDRVQAAVVRLHQDVGTDPHRACLDLAAVGGEAHRETAVVAIEKMHVALEVAYSDEQGELYRSRYAASEQLVLLPDRGTGVLVHSEHCAARVRHIYGNRIHA